MEVENMRIEIFYFFILFFAWAIWEYVLSIWKLLEIIMIFPEWEWT
jgi:hypothetical protein